MTEIWNLSTLCRCCHSDGSFKSLNQAYHNTNGVEIYEMLLHEALGIRISKPQMEASYTICDTCIKRLRDASQFKEQVLACERKFQVYCTNEQFPNVTVIQNLKTEIEFQNCDNECIDAETCKDNTNMQCIKNDTDVTIKEEAITIEVDFNYRVEDTKEDIKLEEEKIVYEAKVKLSKETDTEAKNAGKGIKKGVLQKKVKSVKDMGVKANKTPYFGSRQWQLDKVRHKLLHSFIVSLKTKEGITYSCKTCAGSYKNKKDILKHIRMQHIGRYKCQQCNKPFPHEYTLRRHMKKVHGNELYQCNHCKKTFTCKSNMKVHETTHTREYKYKCDVCEKLFLYRGTLRKHIKQMHTPNIIYNKFICDMCGLSFYDRTNLEIHIRTVHLKQRPHACNICGKTYTAKKHVKNHMKIHSDNPKPHQCDECSRKFACPKSLKYHKLTQHSDQTQFPCRYCSAVFDNKKERDVHIRVHPQSINDALTCHICGKILMTKFTLNRHIESHNGIKRYCCEICGVRFGQKALVERHRKRKHNPNISTEKVKCEVCKKMVRNIDRHMTTHDDEKRFYCDICGKSYAENNALTRHKKHVHYGVSYDCVYCGKKYINKRSLASHEIKVHKKVKKEIVENTDDIRDEKLESK